MLVHHRLGNNLSTRHALPLGHRGVSFRQSTWWSTDESGAHGGRHYLPLTTNPLHHFYRHDHRGCGLGKPWTSFELPGGCTCKPTYYTVVRKDGKLLRERVGKNRRDAGRALAQVTVAVDTGSYLAPRNVSFDAWADEWIAGLRRAKESTRYGYGSTLDHAKGAFGHKRVRDLRIGDVTSLLTELDAAVCLPPRKRSTCACWERVWKGRCVTA